MRVEELVDVSEAKIRADKVHERLVTMGFTGTERPSRWAFARRRSRGKPAGGALVGHGRPSLVCSSICKHSQHSR